MVYLKHYANVFALHYDGVFIRHLVLMCTKTHLLFTILIKADFWKH